MKNQISLSILSIFLISLTIAVNAQTKNEEPVTIDLENRTMTLPPFDDKFQVNSFSADYDTVKFKYYLNDIVELKEKQKNTLAKYDAIKTEIIKDINNAGEIDVSVLNRLVDNEDAIKLKPYLKRFTTTFRDSGVKKEVLIGLITGTLKFKKNKFVSTDMVDQTSVSLVYQFYSLLVASLPNLNDLVTQLNSLNKVALDLDNLNNRINSMERGGNYYFLGDEFYLNMSNKKAFFPKSIGPLHPEVSYTFEFKGTKSIDLEPNDLKSLKAQTILLIEEYFGPDIAPSTQSIKLFKSEIHNLMKEYSKSDKIFNERREIVDENDVIFTESTLWPTVDSLDDEYENIINKNEDIETNYKQLTTKFLKYQFIFDRLEQLYLRSSIKPSDALTKTILEQPLNSGLERNKLLTFEQFLGLLLNPSETDFLVKIFKEKYMVNGNGLAKGNDIDAESIYLLKAFFEKLRARTFLRFASKGTKDERIFIPKEDSLIEDISFTLNNLKKNIDSKNTSLAKIKYEKTNVPNLLENLFITEKIAINKSIQIDVFAEKNAYVGLDLGLMYAFGLNGLFTFQGTHFYLVPINREAPFKYFDDFNKYFLKRFSFYIGIAQLISERDDRFDDIFAKNSIALGMGYRINRVLRLNLGGIMYNELDPNPLRTGKTLKMAPTISLSVDIDLSKALGALGTALKF